MSGHCRVCGETICVCDEKIETISEKIETISEENRMSELCKLDGFHPIPALGAMKLALKALQNTATHPQKDAEQYEAEMDAMVALDDAIDDQREWFGLTDHDIHQLRQQGAHSVSDKEFRVIEAKLKEKNT